MKPMESLSRFNAALSSTLSSRETTNNKNNKQLRWEDVSETDLTTSDESSAFPIEEVDRWVADSQSITTFEETSTSGDDTGGSRSIDQHADDDDDNAADESPQPVSAPMAQQPSTAPSTFRATTAKTIPAPTKAYKILCLSFLDDDIPTSVASTVFDEAMRVLQPNGLLYVVDRPANSGSVVARIPKMRQILTRVRQPTREYQDHEREARAILEANGFDTSSSSAGRVVRWMGIKKP